jgi:hypothetical protein
LIEVPKAGYPLGSFPEKAPAWWPLKKSDGSLTAWFRCPNGHLGMLSAHQIAADGTVSLSVLCVHPPEGCGFHDYIKLLGWTQ